jgi:hypothetical protein
VHASVWADVKLEEVPQLPLHRAEQHRCLRRHPGLGDARPRGPRVADRGDVQVPRCIVGNLVLERK